MHSATKVLTHIMTPHKRWMHIGSRFITNWLTVPVRMQTVNTGQVLALPGAVWELSRQLSDAIMIR
jgi:hypothetical protein